MRIDRLRIPALGGLRDVDTGPEPLPGLVVITGPNEAGKTTFLEAVRTLLYGIYPTRRDKHPLAPWDGTEASILGEFRSTGDDTVTVHRRILATPWGRIVEGGMESNLRNGELPAVAHVPREIYRQVHAIALPEMAQLQQGDAWAMIRDRILAGMGTRDLAPPRAVAQALEASAGALWRSRQQGNFRDRMLAEEIESLGARLREARQSDLDLRSARQLLARDSAELKRLREERAALAEVERQATELLPLAGRLRYLDELAAAAGPAEELRDLPASPRERHAELLKVEAAAARDEEFAAARLERIREEIPDPDPSDVALLDSEVAIEQVVPVARAGDAARERMLEQRTRVERLRDEVRELAGPLLSDPDEVLDPARRAPFLQALRILAIDELRASMIRRSEAASRALPVEEEQVLLRNEDPPSPPRTRAASTPWVLLAMGLLLAGAGTVVATLGESPPLLGFLAALSGLVLSGVGLYIGREDARALKEHRRRMSERQSKEEGLRARLDEHRSAEARAMGEIRALLEGTGLLDARLHDPGDALASALERLRGALRGLERAEDELATEAGRVAKARHRVQALAWSLGLGPPPEAMDTTGTDPDAPPSVELTSLEAALRDARSRRETREAALEEERRREETSREARRRREEAQAQRQALEALLRSVMGGEGSEGASDPVPAAEAAEVAEARVEALRRQRALVAELESAHGPLRDLRRAVDEAETRWQAEGRVGAGDDGEGDGSPDGTMPSLSAARAHLEALSARIDALQEQVTRNRTLLERTDQVPTVDLLESELHRLREAREEARRERDRLWLLARLTRVAERRFRETHQPQLVRGAETILARITRNRYDTLILGDDENPDALQVRGSHMPGGHRIEPPLSTGIQEQVWFSLRMAVVPLVEAGGEPLPLILDEVFVNWDSQRRSHALDALAELSEERQILLVTCHPWLADEARLRGARVVDLTPEPLPAQRVLEPLP